MKIVSAAVVINDRKVLIARRKADDKLAGFWEFPGGKIEDKETPQECLKRELKEELGIETTVGDILCESIYKYGHGGFKILALQTNLYSKDFVLSSHDKIDWVPIHNLLNYKLLPADIPIAKKIIELAQV